MTPDSIVFGAAGFVGRSLVAELLRRGRRVAAAVRGPEERLTSWLAGQEVDAAGLTVVASDVTVPGLGLAGLDGVRDVYNAAARFAFGLSVEEARLANVTGAVNVADWAAARPGLRRLVHVSGYRVSDAEPDYGALGAYEASKAEGDAAVRRRARELGVPLTVVNPATVIGPGQFIGLASLVHDLWHGRLPVLPGGSGVFLPVVDIDYFARFMAAVPEHEETAGRAYWVLDDATPELPELVALLAGHLGVRAPRRSIPVGLVRRLPRALTGADPETLSFMSADRYDTAPALAFARRAGLHMPPVGEALRRWADELVAARFGAAPNGRGSYGAGGKPVSRVEGPVRPYGFRDVAGVRTWVTGAPETPRYVLLHGLPLDADSWAEVAARLDAPVLAPDLPGLGRSAPLPAGRPASASGGTDGWLAGLLRPVITRPLLVGHSAGCGPALRYAVAHPDRIAGLVLVAPAFLQEPAGWFSRSRLAAPALRRMSRERLGRGLGVPPGAPADLSRPGAARRVLASMRTAHADGRELRPLLDRVEVPVTLVAGSGDPLAVDRPAVLIGGAGHYPQLTHPGELAEVLSGARAGVRGAGRS
ncbi:alpha/beta fold hydrolase [Planomonospora sp. ID67723]|uniref:alpha/beta fold hydrolase n=1 Tax=Planomonospora sp. ID67723 TaxID=2738134 RepID=UPI0018C384F6|nr:alpha/beta fold hydrolase [Planomonospora sp. ID67723]MBG0830583.1 alpha/beta fold hydrolase [Planomonospora sp. ID67723]